MPEATATPQPVLGDLEDFLAWVQNQRERYEFAGGRLVLMADGSEDHNDIQINLLTSLVAIVNQLEARRARNRDTQPDAIGSTWA
jgi:Uma2 family endonuclease